MGPLFTKQEAAAWGGFIVAQARLFQRIEEDLRRHFHITHAEFEVLLRLAWAPERRARIQDLAAESLLSRSGTSRAVDRLVKAGHLRREGAAEDGRGAYAVITEDGRRHFLAAARQHVGLVRREFLSKFTEPELELLTQFWSRLDDAPPGEAPPAEPRAKRRRSDR